MNVQFKEMLNEITRFMENEATTKTIIGEAFKLGKFDCIPVIRVGMGFGSTQGERDLPKKEHDEGLGAGAGMGISPIGFLVAKEDEITFIATKPTGALATAFEKAPELIEKYLDVRKAQAVEN